MGHSVIRFLLLRERGPVVAVDPLVAMVSLGCPFMIAKTYLQLMLSIEQFCFRQSLNTEHTLPLDTFRPVTVLARFLFVFKSPILVAFHTYSKPDSRAQNGLAQESAEEPVDELDAHQTALVCSSENRISMRFSRLT